MNVLACNESTKDKVTYTIDSYLRSTLPHLVLVISYDTFRLYVDRSPLKTYPKNQNFLTFSFVVDRFQKAPPSKAPDILICDEACVPYFKAAIAVMYSEHHFSGPSPEECRHRHYAGARKLGHASSRAAQWNAHAE